MTMGSGIHTYYATELQERIFVVAKLEYGEEDERRVGKLIRKAVELHVKRLEKKHKITHS